MPKIWIALFVMVPCLFAQGGETNCQEVGAAILTNFLPEHGTIILFPSGEQVNFSSIALGSATGDLRGGVIIYVLNMTSTTIQAQGNWVTESGDTIYTTQASATTSALIPGSAVSAAIYPAGLTVIGGTGRFAGAKGKINILFGASDFAGFLNDGQFIFRYQGQICFAQSK